MTTVSTASGGTLVLGKILGKGGEGTVHHVEGRNDLAVKLYTDGKGAERRDKVGTMVAAGYHRMTDFVAFPVDIILGPNGGFAGFTMRKVSGVHPIHELYSPGSRKSEFPAADFSFLVRTAANLSRAIASIHQAGCVIGDINHSGVLVGDKATVTLIDSDSFQIRSGSKVYRCRVGVGEYTPPELQGLPLETVDRSIGHDAFGLAVLLFQLLFQGKHPFAGRYSGAGDMPIDKAIREGRFAYSSRKAQTKMDPPPFALAMSDLPAEVANAFERAFELPGAPSHQRPTAAAWVATLDAMEQQLTTCRVNPAHQHLKNAGSCPWCRIEGGAGITLFQGRIGSGYSAGPVFDTTGAMAAIERVAGPGPAPDPADLLAPGIRLQPSPTIIAMRRKTLLRKLAGVAVFGLASFLMSHGIGLAFIGILVGGGMIFVGGDTSGLVSKKLAAEKAWLTARGQWITEAGRARFDAKKTELQGLLAEYGQLPALEKKQLDGLEQRKHQIQMETHLDAHLISRAKIKGIGDSRKATLRSFGIENAHDVTYNSVLQVPGFGDGLARTMLAWRSTVERKFVFNPSRPTDPAAIKSVKDGIARRRNEIEQALKRGPIDLQQITAHAMALRANPGRGLMDSYVAFKQAELDAAT